jgi:hypothetical protein
VTERGTEHQVVATERWEVPRVEHEDVLLRFGRQCYFLGVMLIPLLNIRLSGDSFTASDAILGVALFATACSLGKTKRPARTPIVLACFLVAVAGTAATAMALSPIGSELIVVRLLFIVGLWPWMTRHLIRRPVHLERAVRLWVAAAVVFGLVSLVQTRVPSFLSAGLEANGRIMGLAGHPTDAGGVLCIGVVTLVGLWPRDRRWFVVWLAAIAVTGIGLVLSGSVSGFIAVALGLLVLFFRMRQGLGARALTVLAVTFGTFVAVRLVTSGVVGGVSPAARISSTTSGQYDTLSARIQTYHNGWQGILHDPLLGKGMDPKSGIVVQPDLDVHNMFLLAWYQGGILMLAGLVIFIVYAMRSGIRPGLGHNRLVSALFAGSATALAFAMTSPLVVQRYLWAPLVLLLATCEVFPSPSDAERPPDTAEAPSSSRIRR